MAAHSIGDLPKLRSDWFASLTATATSWAAFISAQILRFGLHGEYSKFHQGRRALAHVEDAMTLALNFSPIRIVQNVESWQLETYYESILLWSTPVTCPGSEGEATEFYTKTLIALLDAWRGMSNHAKMALLAAETSSEAGRTRGEGPLLGDYHVA